MPNIPPGEARTHNLRISKQPGGSPGTVYNRYSALIFCATGDTESILCTYLLWDTDGIFTLLLSFTSVPLVSSGENITKGTAATHYLLYRECTIVVSARLSKHNAKYPRA